jgi:hypothetical protein
VLRSLGGHGGDASVDVAVAWAQLEKSRSACGGDWHEFHSSHGLHDSQDWGGPLVLESLRECWFFSGQQFRVRVGHRQIVPGELSWHPPPEPLGNKNASSHHGLRFYQLDCI